MRWLAGSQSTTGPIVLRECLQTERSSISETGRSDLLIPPRAAWMGWDAGIIFEETTQTLFCGDLFTRLGDGPALTLTDIVEPAMEAEDFFALTSLGPTTAPSIRGLRRPQAEDAPSHARLFICRRYSSCHQRAG